MSGARPVRCSVCRARVAITAAAISVCGAWPAATLANTAVTVVGSATPSASGTNPGNLRATQAYSNNAAPTSSTDVVISSTTINPSGLLLDNVSSSTTISVGSLDDTATGVLAQIANNNSSGASTINLGGGSGTNTVGSPADLIYVKAGAGTVFNISGGVPNGHTFTLALQQSGNFDVGAGANFYFNQGPSGTLSLGPNTLTTAGAGTTTFAANVTGTGGLNVSGGTTVLTTASTYTGPTNVLAGTLNLSLTTTVALAAASAVTVSSGATLQITNHAGGGQQPYANPITLNGTAGSSNNGSIYFFNSGAFSMTGPIALASDAAVGFNPVNQTTASLVTFSSAISGAGSLTLFGADTGTGTPQVALTAASAYAGPNTILTSSGNGSAAAFLVSLSGGANRLPATTNLIFGGAPVGQTGTFNQNVTLSIDNNSQAVAGLSVAPGATGAYSVVGSNASAGTLVVNNASADTFSGTIGGAGNNNNNLALSMVGSSTLSLSGANTYVGGTSISSGTLQANNGTSSLGTGTTVIGAAAGTAGTGGTLAGGTKGAAGATGGAVTLNATGTITAGTGATATDAVGTLAVTTLNAAGGQYAVKLDGSAAVPGPAASGTAGAAASDVLVLSALTTNGPASLTINPVLILAAAGQFAPSTTYSFVIADATGSANATAFDALINQGAASAIVVAGGNGAGTFSLSTMPDGATGNVGEDLLLDFTTAAAPEPGSLLLAAIGALPLTMRRRRRASSSRCVLTPC